MDQRVVESGVVLTKHRNYVSQRTLKCAMGCTGIGLHSGQPVTIRLCPAEPDTGIVLRRTDVANGGSLIPVTWRNVVATQLATTLGNDHGITVSTVEHVMAALSGCGIDNAVIEIDGPEMPIMDGSSAPFVFLIECAGTVEQDAPRQALQVLKPVSVGEGSKRMTVSPYDGFFVRFEIDFDSSVVARQDLGIDMIEGAFKKEVARARTFGFEHEVARLRQAGFALGGSLDNAVVIGEKRVLNEDGLRYPDEFVRHKILDCVGDLYLAGGPILGHVHCVRGGHALSYELLQALFADDGAWAMVDMPAPDDGIAYPAWKHEAQLASA